MTSATVAPVSNVPAGVPSTRTWVEPALEPSTPSKSTRPGGSNNARVAPLVTGQAKAPPAHGDNTMRPDAGVSLVARTVCTVVSGTWTNVIASDRAVSTASARVRPTRLGNTGE